MLESKKHIMNYAYKSIFFCTVLILSLRCSKNIADNTKEKSFQEKLSENVVVPNEPINTGIIIKFYEDIFQTTSRKLIIHCYTEEIYPSSGYKIINTFAMQDSILDIDFINIEAPEGGIAIESPAFTIFEISSLYFDNWILKIVINGKTILGQISNLGISYKIQIQPNNILAVKDTTIFKVPLNLIWGQTESINSEPYKMFLDSLKFYGANSYDLQSG
ncbi:MAG: hypothetical protein JXC36_02485, partial [Candidatus Atribacteria bacterium]|nr:hypothetical protein [Candidatus Atribacteria bacterium]